MSAPVVASVATTVNSTPGTSCVVTKPSGTVSGDLLIGFLQVEGDLSVTAPSGWTLIHDQVAQFSAGELHCHYLVAGGSEPADYSWSWTGSHANNGGILRITGQHATAYIDATAEAVDDGVDETQPSPSVTTTVADCLIIRGIGNERIGNGPVVTLPPSHTSSWDIEGTPDFDDTWSAVAWINQASAGASGTADWVLTGLRGSAHIVVAVAPAAGGGGGGSRRGPGSISMFGVGRL